MRLILALLLTLGGLSAFSQEIFPPDAIKKTLTAQPIESNLHVDGRLTEAEWSVAIPVKGFTQTDPVQGAPAHAPTTVRLLYNRNYLYVGVVCYDTTTHGRYRVQNFKRDNTASYSDFFAFAIDGYNDERNCMMFGVNPYGVQRDLLSFDDNIYDPDWDGLWMVRTQRTDTAWIAEIAVPWKTLRYRRRSDSLQTWGISFGRIARTINEFSNWPSFPRAYGGLRMPYAAKLVDLKAPPPSTNIRVQPYMLYSYRDTRQNGHTLSSDNTVKPGGDIKWAVNPNTLLDLTFNTDFAQADVDRLVNNTSRFSVFYPEKRQFFLENAGLFTVGADPVGGTLSDYSNRIQPFFSRAIGLDSLGSPLNITAGARMVYRSGTTNAGGMFIRQEANAYTPAANFMVGRYSRNIGQQGRLGALVSFKDADGGSKSPGSRDLTATIDGFFRITQGLSLRTMLSTTADRYAANGYAASAQLLYNTNRLIAWWNSSVVTNRYNPVMGFVARGNTIVTDPGFIWQERGKWLPSFVRAFTPGIGFTTYHDPTTRQLTDRYVNITPLSFQFQHGGTASWSIVQTDQVLGQGFAPLGVNMAAGRYSFTRHKIVLSSDPSARLAATLTGNLGGYYNGQYRSFAMNVTASPIPHIYFAPGVEFGKLEQVGIAQVDRNVTLYTMEGRLALNPRLQLSALYQRSDVTATESWNVRFSWEFQPLSYVYLVFNHNGTDRQLITKVSWLKQL